LDTTVRFIVIPRLGGPYPTPQASGCIAFWSIFLKLLKLPYSDCDRPRHIAFWAVHIRTLWISTTLSVSLEFIQIFLWHLGLARANTNIWQVLLTLDSPNRTQSPFPLLKYF
jgi:hypothetical protein